MNIKKEKITLAGGVPALLLGERSDKVFLFVHGQCGRKEEAAAFASVVCPGGWQVLGVDLPCHGGREATREGLVPWDAVPELRTAMEYLRSGWSRIGVRANSIGAWLSLICFRDEELSGLLLVSPILDMEGLIRSMMKVEGVSEERLEAEGEIMPSSGQLLSYRYLRYAAENRITAPRSRASILYAGNDMMTDRKTVDRFALEANADLTVMEDGEHWFHTPEQLDFLKKWESCASGVIT